MSTFQRMIVIPQEEYLSLSTMQNVQEPLAQHFYDLEKRHNQEEKEEDSYRRMIMQSNTLNEMKKVKDQMRNSLVVSTPKPYQSRANALFQNMESFLKFNEKGEIYSQDGTLIPGSRLEDLIQHAVRDRRRNLIPTGWSNFLTLLREHNVPKSILNRDTLDELEGKAIPSSPITVKEEPSTQKAPIKKRQVRKASKLKPPSQFDSKIYFLRKYKDA